MALLTSSSLFQAIQSGAPGLRIPLNRSDVLYEETLQQMKRSDSREGDYFGGKIIAMNQIIRDAKKAHTKSCQTLSFLKKIPAPAKKEIDFLEGIGYQKIREVAASILNLRHVFERDIPQLKKYIKSLEKTDKAARQIFAQKWGRETKSCFPWSRSVSIEEIETQISLNQERLKRETMQAGTEERQFSDWLEKIWKTPFFSILLESGPHQDPYSIQKDIVDLFCDKSYRSSTQEALQTFMNVFVNPRPPSSGFTVQVEGQEKRSYPEGTPLIETRGSEPKIASSFSVRSDRRERPQQGFGGDPLAENFLEQGRWTYRNTLAYGTVHPESSSQEKTSIGIYLEDYINYLAPEGLKQGEPDLRISPPIQEYISSLVELWNAEQDLRNASEAMETFLQETQERKRNWIKWLKGKEDQTSLKELICRDAERTKDSIIPFRRLIDELNEKIEQIESREETIESILNLSFSEMKRNLLLLRYSTKPLIEMRAIAEALRDRLREARNLRKAVDKVMKVMNTETNEIFFIKAHLLRGRKKDCLGRIPDLFAEEGILPRSFTPTTEGLKRAALLR